MMKYAQEMEAQRRAGRADGGTVKAALKMLGKLLPEGSGYAGVPGKPSLVNLPGIGKVEARPIPEVESAASKYMQTIGRPGERREGGSERGSGHGFGFFRAPRDEARSPYQNHDRLRSGIRQKTAPLERGKPQRAVEIRFLR